jgi:hypothetical protein
MASETLSMPFLNKNAATIFAIPDKVLYLIGTRSNSSAR